MFIDDDPVIHGEPGSRREVSIGGGADAGDHHIRLNPGTVYEPDAGNLPSLAVDFGDLHTAA